MILAVVLQVSLVDAAKRHFGEDGERIVRDAADQHLGISLDEVTYSHLPDLFAAIQVSAVQAASRAAGTALAEAFVGLHDVLNGEMRDHLVRVIAEQLGPAAQPFLSTLLTHLALPPLRLNHTHQALIIETVRHMMDPVLGVESAQRLATAVTNAVVSQPALIAGRAVQTAVDLMGPDGIALVEQLCRERLGIQLAQLDGDAFQSLTELLAHDGIPEVSAMRVERFMSEARGLVHGVGSQVQDELLPILNDYLGPAGTVFLKRMTVRFGLPPDAICYEHLGRLAETVRTEATPILGQSASDQLAVRIIGLLNAPAASQPPSSVRVGSLAPQAG